MLPHTAGQRRGRESALKHPALGVDPSDVEHASDCIPDTTPIIRVLPPSVNGWGRLKEDAPERNSCSCGAASSRTDDNRPARNRGVARETGFQWAFTDHHARSHRQGAVRGKKKPRRLAWGSRSQLGPRRRRGYQSRPTRSRNPGRSCRATALDRPRQRN